MKKMFAAALVLIALLLGACKKSEDSVRIAVFIPGVGAGAAIYDMLASGGEEAVAEWQTAQGMPVALNIIEGGYNQAAWEDEVTALAASGQYDVIISSNPSLPAIVADVLEKFPAQKFILFDGELPGNPSVYTLRYDQREQGYMAGHIAALVSEELRALGNEAIRPKKLGLVAGQEYPAMNNVILPAYLEGAKAVDAGYSVDFRVLGNWFDAQKAADLAQDMLNGGVKVILAVAGGANEGVLQTAAEKGAKVVWFDINGYALKEGVVIGSAVIHQQKAAREKTLAFLGGTLPFGRAEYAGVREGYVDFIEDDPIYRNTVSEPVRQKQSALLQQIRAGRLQ